MAYLTYLLHRLSGALNGSQSIRFLNVYHHVLNRVLLKHNFDSPVFLKHSCMDWFTCIVKPQAMLVAFKILLKYVHLQFNLYLKFLQFFMLPFTVLISIHKYISFNLMIPSIYQHLISLENWNLLKKNNQNNEFQNLKESQGDIIWLTRTLW